MRNFVQYYALPIILSIVCVFGLVFMPSQSFTRDQFSSGAWWLVISSQFTHITYSHCLLNVLGLWAQWFGFRYWLNQSTLALGLFFGMVGVGMWLVLANIDFYMGLSGALHGSLMAATLAMFWIKKPLAKLFAMILLCLLLCKAFGEWLIVLSQSVKPHDLLETPFIQTLLSVSKFLFVQADFQVAYVSHWVGLLGGMFAFVVLFLKGSVRASIAS